MDEEPTPFTSDHPNSPSFKATNDGEPVAGTSDQDRPSPDHRPSGSGKVISAPGIASQPEGLSSIPESSEKAQRRLDRRVVAGVAVVAVGLAAFVALKNMNDHASAPVPGGAVAASTPGSSPSPSSSETTSDSEHARLVEANRIPSGLSNEEYARTLIQRLEAWDNLGAGANNDTMKQFYAAEANSIDKGGSGMEVIDFTQAYAKDHASEFGEAIFVDPSNAEISVVSSVNGNILYDYLSTVDNKVNGAQEGYRLTLTYNSVREVSPGVLEINYTVSDNSDKMGGLVHNIGMGGAKMQVTVKNIGGYAMIEDWKDLSIYG